MTSVLWCRRDLRLADNPALLSAVGEAADAALRRPAGPARRASLTTSLTDLGHRIGGCCY